MHWFREVHFIFSFYVSFHVNELPTRLELVVNAKTATLLGITIPRSVLSRADEIVR